MRERVAQADVARARRQRDAGRVAEVEQVGDAPLGQRPVRRERDLERLLVPSRQAFGVVAFERDEALVVAQREVRDQQVRARDAVFAPAAAVALAVEVERVDAAHERIVAGDRAFEHRVERAAVVGEGHALEAVRAREVRGPRAGGVRRAHAGQRDRRLLQPPVAVRVQQIGPELLTEPQVATAVLAHGLDVEVTARQQPLARALVDDVPRHAAVRVAERDRVLDLDLSGPATRGLPVGLDLVQAQQEGP